LAKGLAVRCDDERAADRYRRRIGLITGQFDTNSAASETRSETRERLLWASGRWLTRDTVERDEHEQKILKLSADLMELLSPSAAS
jgi:hypothetical protein